MVLLIAGLTGLLCFLLVLLLLVYGQHLRRQNILYRMRYYQVTETAGPVQAKALLKKGQSLLTRLARPISRRESVQALDLKMRQAGLPLLGGEFFVLLWGIALLMGVAAWMLTLTWQLALLATVLGAALIWGIVLLRIRKRRNIFTEQLGDCLTTIANALRAGYSFQQAVDVVAREMEPPISDEFAQVSREVSMGVPLESALEAMGRRVGSMDLDLVITAVLIQREVGGNLAKILDNIGDTIQERIRMKREIFALTAQGRLSAWVLILLPFLMALFLYIFSPEQLMILIDDPLGRLALMISMVLELIGYVVIQKIVHIDV